jgi:hypothetical protein
MAFFHACITSLDIENSLSIFTCRVAGNVENFDILGSMEFDRKLSGAIWSEVATPHPQT